MSRPAGLISLGLTHHPAKAIISAEIAHHHGAHQAKTVLGMEITHVIEVVLPSFSLFRRYLTALLGLVKPALMPIKHLINKLLILLILHILVIPVNRPESSRSRQG